MNKFLQKHILARPTHFDSNSLLVMICGLTIMFSPIISCGPSKAEIEEREKRGEVWSNGKFVKVANNPYETETEEEPKPPTSSEEIGYDDIEVRVIDSCEYIIYLQVHHTTGNIIHKANCRNPIHKTNQ